jgi:hypothetical protein
MASQAASNPSVPKAIFFLSYQRRPEGLLHAVTIQIFKDPAKTDWVM